MTSLAEELTVQSRWRLRPECAGLRWFDQLVKNEFLPADECAGQRWHEVAGLLAYASARVPYYRQRYGSLGLHVEGFRGIADLQRLPILRREDLQEHFARLQPAELPAGEQFAGRTQSSGSTGQPVAVAHSATSVLMTSLVKQRESRWLRYDPMAMLAMIRHPSDLPRSADGAPLADGETKILAAWRYVGRFFETGSYLCFGDTNPVDRQLEWLQQYRPAYVTALSSHLEHLALAWARRAPSSYLHVILSIAQQLTPAMEERISTTFAADVHVNYGLNEIGIVATRCREGGRYHVHPECCVVEIVDDEGRAVDSGAAGRLVVTALRNAAMPLIRYDSGDIAESVDGPCPCGRTLPAFGGIRGRYRRMAFLPAGTWDYWVALQKALARAPGDELRPLRQYQLHQYRDGRFELRLKATARLPQTFHDRVLDLWRQAATGDTAKDLGFSYVEKFPASGAGKFENFTSEFFPAQDRAAGPQAR